MLSGAARPAYLATAVGAGGGGGGAGGADATGAAETLADGAADVTGGGGGGAGGGGSSPPHDAASSRANGSDVFLIDRIMARGLLGGRLAYHVRGRKKTGHSPRKTPRSSSLRATRPSARHAIRPERSS